MVTGGHGAAGRLAQINPIWQFGSYDAYKISYAVQPDWYMGWLDGALRIMPSWEFAVWGHTIPFEVFLPAVVFPGLDLHPLHGVADDRTQVHEDNEMHNLLDRPRDRPKRTAAGVGHVRAAVHAVRRQLDRRAGQLLPRLAERGALVLPLRGLRRPDRHRLVAYRMCREMQGVHGIGKRKRAVVVHRSAEGEYSTVPSAPRPDDERNELDPEPVPVRIDIEP